MSKKQYDVLSPIGIPLTCHPFVSKELALAAIPELCKRFESQGYFSLSPGQVIPVGELPGYLEVVEAGFRVKCIHSDLEPRA
jgi:hypothetical protein